VEGWAASFLTGIIGLYAESIPAILGLAVLFTVAFVFQSQAMYPDRPWWRNPGLGTDITYMVVHGVLGPYFRLPAIFLISVVAAALLSTGTIAAFDFDDYFVHGAGPLAGLPFWQQALVYVLGTDFLHYWLHRMFHRPRLWKFHAVHHSAEHVDWTTAYRFHPVNLALQPALVTVVMLMLGISPKVVAFLIPWDILSAAFVHANLNWTLGPFRYVFATPVFHRWHHGAPEHGGEKNFAPTFAFFDVFFGTFYMPKATKPGPTGVTGRPVPEGYFRQLIYPLRGIRL
jgi:sterol desaturase/sphingolipid hydroxylase (fatty acid hydroxylase superfamily)